MSFLIFVIMGCSFIRIESDPPGAVILHSKTGLAPWKPLGNPQNPRITPAVFSRFRASQHFFRVDKHGYYTPLPKIVETYPFHKETIRFQLEKTPQTIEEEYLADGYIRYKDQWVKPKDAGLVDYKGEWMTPEEKFAKEQRDKGLVLHDGEWITPEERDRVFADEQKAKGLVPFKGRWINTDEKDQEDKIDLFVDDTFKNDHRNPQNPTTVGTITEKQTRIRVLNGIGDKILFYFSGKKSFRVALDPYESQNLDIIPGTYRIACTALSQNIQPSCWTFEFKAGFRYSLVEEGEPLLDMNLERTAISPEDIKKQYEIPELKIPDSPTSGTREKKERMRSGNNIRTQP